MTVAEGLLRHCRNAMIPEPLIIVPDGDGNPQFPPYWDAPARTWIDVSDIFFRGWVVIEPETHLVKILIGDRSLVYERIGYGLHGEWICDLRSGGANASPG